MTNPLFVLKSFLLGLVLLSTSNCIHAQSLKGFTLGKEPPIVNLRYQTELETTVSGVKGLLSVTIFHSDLTPFSKKWRESLDDIRELDIYNYKAKYGAPKISMIVFRPFYVVENVVTSSLFGGNPNAGPSYPELVEYEFIENLENHYSISLNSYTYNDETRWVGKGFNFSIRIDSRGLVLSDINLSTYHDKEKELRNANDF